MRLTEENLPAIEARLAELNIKYHVHRDGEDKYPGGPLVAMCLDDPEYIGVIEVGEFVGPLRADGTDWTPGVGCDRSSGTVDVALERPGATFEVTMNLQSVKDLRDMLNDAIEFLEGTDVPLDDH